MDANHDGEIQCSEALTLTGTLDVSSKGISNLTGIEAFTNITGLDCHSNSLTSLDVSSNTALFALNCRYNSLMSLDVHLNTALSTLYCNDNLLANLNISGLTLLYQFDCSRNQLMSLNISANTALNDLNCGYNLLTNLDVSSNTALTFLNCTSNQITNLDLTSNTALAVLYCSNNQLASLNASFNTALIVLYGNNNLLTSLDVANLTSLYEITCGSNLLTGLDVSSNTALANLFCESNQLTGLDVSSNTALAVLSCESNQLTSLDVSANTALNYLSCFSNSLTSLDLKNGNNSNLSSFNATNNPGLTCVQVDDAAYMNTNWASGINGSEVFNTDCTPPCIVNIPNTNFKAALLAISGLDANSDGEIQCAEALTLTGTLNVSSKSISNLTGIEAFTNITTLNCSSNSLTSLDVSANTALHNLNCSSNSLTSLDISHNTALNYLYCSYNSLTSLDVHLNTALIFLYCDNISITSLNVAANTALTSLSCNNNSLTSLDVHLNTALTSLSCHHNSLTSLDVAVNTALNNLVCNHNSLTSFNVSTNTALTNLVCNNNLLTSLDVHLNTALKYLLCNNNLLTSLDVHLNTVLIYLFCNSNSLTSLNVKNGNNTNFTYYSAANNAGLSCIQVDNAAYCNSHTPWSNGINGSESYSAYCSPCTVNIPNANFKAALLAIAGLDANSDGEIQCSEALTLTGTLNVSNKSISNLTGIEAFTNITQLVCNNNSLTSLDVSANTALISLDCQNNSLTSLDVHLNTALNHLYFSHNSLTNLDVHLNTALTTFNCSYNSLTSLNVSSNTALTWVHCDYNSITSLVVSANTALTYLDCHNNSLTSLDVHLNTALNYLYFSHNSLTSLNVAANTALLGLGCDYNSLTSLNISTNTALTNLTCNNNSISSLNVSTNTALTYLICNTNSISSLDVSANTALQFLICDHNSLTSLGVSTNTALVYLYCNNNSISSLDVAHNTALQFLICNNNSISSLDVHLNTALIYLNCSYNSLTSLNVKNGNNTNFISFSAINNAGLSCIQVDNVAYCNSHTTWSNGINGSESYNTNCSFAATDYFRSIATGNWSNPSIWESSNDNSTWGAATLAPTSAATLITIKSPNNVTINVNNQTASCIVIESGATLTNSGSNTLLISGNWTNNGGTFTAATGTVNFNGTFLQLIGGTSGTTFNNLSTNNSTFVKLYITTTINNTLSISGPFSDDGNQITCNGTLLLNSGEFDLGSVTAATTWPGFTSITIHSYTYVVYKAGVAQTVATTYASGSIPYQQLYFAPSTGTKTTASGTLTISQNWDVESTTNLSTNSTDVNLSGNLHEFSDITSGSGTINISGNWVVHGGTFSPGTGTVNYNGSSTQTVAGLTYNNLTLSGTGVKTTTSATVNGILSMEGTATASVAPTYGASATLQYKGSAAQTTGVEFSSTFSGTGGVIINNANGVVLGTSKSITNGLAITTGALTVNPALNLTVGGTTTLGSAECLIIKSGATGSGSFIDNGIQGSGTAKVERWVSDGGSQRYEYISSPIAAALSTIFSSPIHGLWYVDETQNAWVSLFNNPTTMTVMKGYQRSYQTVAAGGTGNGDANQVNNFTGALNTGNKSIPVTFTSGAPGVNHGWNLVGNPYPSAIDWNASSGWTKTNVNNAIYFRKNGNTYPYVDGSGTATNIIPPMQSFWVRVSATGTLGCNNFVRVHNGTPIYKSTTNNTLELIVTNNDTNSLTDATFIRFRNYATDGFDGQYDAYKMFADNPAYPQLYTRTDSDDISINTLSELNGIRNIPLGFKTTVSGQFTINAEMVSSFTDNGNTVYLEDLQTATFQDLSLNNTYQFSSGVTSGLDRFIVHFNPSITNIKEDVSDQVQIYAYNDEIQIKGLEMLEGDVSVYDVLGQVITTKHLSGVTSEVISMKNVSAVYIVRYTTSSQTITKRIFINH